MVRSEQLVEGNGQKDTLDEELPALSYWALNRICRIFPINLLLPNRRSQNSGSLRLKNRNSYETLRIERVTLCEENKY